MPIASFPWQALPRVSRSEIDAMAGVRAANPSTTCTSVARVLSDLIGHEVAIEVRRRELSSSDVVDLGARGPCLLLSAGSQRVALEVEAELALAIVGALAGARKLPKIALDRRTSPEVAGALGSIVQHVARVTFRDDLVLAVIDVSPSDLRAHMRAQPLIVFEFAVRVGSLKTIARLAITASTSASSRANASSSSSEVLARLGETPLSISLVLASGWARRRDLALQVGDVVVVDALSRKGDCLLAEPFARWGIAAMLLDDVRVRVHGNRLELAPEPAPVENFEPMSETTNETGETTEFPAFGEGNAIADLLADMPIEVRVEAGAVTMPAREWATLGNGDVLVLDRRVGETVLLRIGGKVVGRGELVDVEGSLGVRLVERTS